MNTYPDGWSVDIQHLQSVVRQVFPSAPTRVERVLEGVSTYVYRIIYPRETFYLRILPEEGASFVPEAAVHSQLRQLHIKVPEVIPIASRNTSWMCFGKILLFFTFNEN